MIDRYLNLLKILNKKQSAFLFGPRSVGKSTLVRAYLEKCSEKTVEINLLESDTFERYLREPALFREEILNQLKKSKNNLIVFVDEVQKLPALLEEIHNLISKQKSRLQFILSGSNARKLKRAHANMLGGRAWTLKLHPLSSLEVELDLNRALSIGTLPEPYSESSDPIRFLESYMGTYLREDVQQEALVRNLAGFSRFLDFAGQMNLEPINFSKVGKLINASSNTAQDYFSILTDTMLATRIDGWTFSVKKQLKAAPKFSFFDCGVLNAIRGELRSELKTSSYRFGKLFENFVIQELIRVNEYDNLGYKPFYWRTNTGMEVDLILSRGPSSNPIAFEIKSSEAPDAKDQKGLLSFHSENKNAKLYCLSRTPRAYKIGSIQVLPWRDGIELLQSRV